MIYKYIMGSNLILNEYLESKVITKKNNIISHVSLNKGKYFIDGKELDIFLKLYCKLY